MQIRYVEIQGFRKLESIRIDVGDTTTLFVGANNSGKTSAMDALSAFLTEEIDFTTNDFTLSNWSQINAIGDKWIKDESADVGDINSDSSWDRLIPTLDVWLQVEDNELHYVRGILPSLSWNGSSLGVRLRFEPKDVTKLRSQYVATAKQAAKTKASVPKTKQKRSVRLWPEDLRNFLDRRLGSLFCIKCYLLNPAKQAPPVHGIAQPQELTAGVEPIEGNPLSRLIRVKVIPAQRGFGGPVGTDLDDMGQVRGTGQLTEQLRSYYKKHLDPTEFPEPSDLAAMAAIEEAQQQYDARLRDGFGASMKELEELNYPGITDPVLTIGTRLRPVDGLNHSAAVQYEVAGQSSNGERQAITLPEQYNGLGYQNLISMVFRLMAHRDAWMRVGKASKPESTSADRVIPPLHLVLIEEPEAHLHVQVQQVFVRKAYDILRNHPDLKDNKLLRTQLIVSTHSSHIAHECEFDCLRYFRRLPKRANAVPTSAVINLSEVFGPDDDTARFAKRYLRSTHCELFFADAAILVEGAAERMLVPHFIKHNFDKVHRSFVTLLEISGSHAHRLRSLVEKLGLITVVITDLDSVDPANSGKKAPPRRGANLKTGNTTLREWHPGKDLIDELIDYRETAKAKPYPDVPLFSIRVAYQTPIMIEHKDTMSEIIARTFEDALVLENIDTIVNMPADTSVIKFRDAVAASSNADELSQKLFAAVETCEKAAFALDILFHCNPEKLNVPFYIRMALEWLQSQLDRKESDLLATSNKGGAT